MIGDVYSDFLYLPDHADGQDKKKLHEMKQIITNKPSYSERDIHVTKTRHGFLTKQIKAIHTLFINSNLIDKDIGNVLFMLQEFTSVTKAHMYNLPKHGKKAETKSFNYLMELNTIEKVSRCVRLYLEHLALGETSTNSYFKLSEWDSHQLFSCLDANHQVVVIEKMSNLILSEILYHLPLSKVLEMPMPKEYSPLDWEKVMLEYLKKKGILKEDNKSQTDGMRMYQLVLDFSKHSYSQTDLKHLYCILENHLPLHSTTIYNLDGSDSCGEALKKFAANSDVYRLLEPSE